MTLSSLRTRKWQQTKKKDLTIFLMESVASKELMSFAVCFGAIL
jgi:hypothetical protein